MGTEKLLDLIAAITRIDSARSSGETLRSFRSVLERYGFRDFMIGGLPVAHDPQWFRDILCDGWSPEWFKRYLAQGHFRYDPCAARSRFTSRPFLWSELDRKRMAQKARLVMDEATEFGLKDGICVPIHLPFAGPCVVTAASERIELPADNLPLVETLCVHTFRSLAGLEGGSAEEDAGPALTPREREVLQWSAAGKTAEDIGVILGLTKNTVESHHRHIREKLDAINLVHAVTKAVRRYEIQI